MKRNWLKGVIASMAFVMAFSSLTLGAVVEKGDYHAEINGVALSVPLYENKDHAHMYPVRETAALLGYQVDWDDETHTVTVVDGERVVSYQTGEDRYVVNDEAVSLGAASEIKNNRSYVPSLFFTSFFPVTMKNLSEEKVQVTTEEYGVLQCVTGTVKDAAMHSLQLLLPDGTERSYDTQWAWTMYMDGLTLGDTLTVYAYEKLPQQAVNITETR